MSMADVVFDRFFWASRFCCF